MSSNKPPFQNKVIAITGGASGIGLATAHMLASRGARLSLADVSETGLDAAAADLKQKYKCDGVLTMALDVRHFDKVEQWMDQTLQQFGRLDGAVNMAGVVPKSIGRDGIEEQDPDEWDLVIGVNLTGVMNCLKVQMARIGNGGSIVNASSVAGITGRPKNASYTASKHGVVGLTRSAAREAGSRNIRVNAICPGRIETPLLVEVDRRMGVEPQEKGVGKKMADVPLQRSGQPEEVAGLVVFLLSDDASYITGTAIPIDGGWTC